MSDASKVEWVLVPRVPTPAMLFGATGLYEASGKATQTVHDRYKETWAELIEAAPEPPFSVAAMTIAEDGGPAFPLAYRHWEYQDSPFKGMSLRDYFAGQALANEALGRAYHLTPDILAAYAYRYADAMLAARLGSSAGISGTDTSDPAPAT